MDICFGAQEAKRAIPPGKSFTLVGGCFDLIHVGHLRLLEYAATLEEMLVVAVLSDEYARSYKDSPRPIISEKHRAMMVAGIRGVDLVYISAVSPSSSEPGAAFLSKEAKKHTEELKKRGYRLLNCSYLRYNS